MKITIILLFFLLLISSQNTIAQVTTQFRQGDSIVTGAGCSEGFYVGYLFAPKDIESYQHITRHFGKDKYYVYYQGNPLNEINPNRTEAIYVKSKDSKYIKRWGNGLIITDGKVSYYNEKRIQDIDTANIYYIYNDRIPLFQSKRNVYYEGHLLTELNIDKITIIASHANENFFTDGNVVYYNEILIEGADAKTFRRESYRVDIFDGKEYKFKEIADSQDKNYFYYKGKRITRYPNWTETKMFADSIYDENYTITFASSYQEHDIHARPAIDFYFKGNELEKLTGNKLLYRKKEMRLNEKHYFEDVKGYTIKIYADKELIDLYYYQQDLEEFDMSKFTDVRIVGDGFHFSKEDFNLVRNLGKPIHYRSDTLLSLEKWQHKILALKNNPLVIHLDSSSTFYIVDDEKKYIRSINEYKIDDNLYTKMHTYEGLFMFKIKRDDAKEILGEDIYEYNYDNRKNIDELIIHTTSKQINEGNYFIDVNNKSIESINSEQWVTLRIYCSSDFMKKVKSEYIQLDWQPIKHIISWEEL